MNPIVIKIGGDVLSSPEFINNLAPSIAKLQEDWPCILVHGGGRAIDELMRRLGIEPEFIDGQRVTDEGVLYAAEMTLSGRINKDITFALMQAGLDALGLSGVDRGLLQVEPWPGQLGRVGRIVNVRAKALLELCAEDVIPVISPISAGPDGRYNVNADHAAGAIAGSVCASRIYFLTNVPGVMNGDGVLPRLSTREARQLIKQGVIHGGMIPKTHAALNALVHGVEEALITNLAGLYSGQGTIFVH